MILADTAQLIPAIRSLGVAKGAQLLHQVGQCYTNASVYSLLSGRQLSDLEPHGTGYYGGRKYHRTFEDEAGVSRTGVCWPWRALSFLRVLRSAGFDVHVHNGSRETWWNLFVDYDPLVTHSSTMDEGGFDTPHALDAVLQPDAAWLAAEQQAIVTMQAARPERPTFYFIVYHDIHSAALRETRREVAYHSLVHRLEAWNWDEPESLFWLWADHGDYGEVRIDGRLRPPNWLSWVMVKDNTAQPIRAGRRVMSIRDARSTLLARFAPAALGSDDEPPITEAVDPERIYIVEDSRFGSDSEHCDAAAAVMFVDWKEGLPRFILQCTYDDKKRYGWDFQFFVSEFNDGRPREVRAVDSFFQDWRLRHLSFTSDPHERLKKALRARIDWVSREGVEPVRRRPGLLALALREVARLALEKILQARQRFRALCDRARATYRKSVEGRRP